MTRPAVRAFGLVVAVAASAACERRPRSEPSFLASADRHPDARPETGSAALPPEVHTDRPWITFTDVTAGSGLEDFRLHAGSEKPKQWLIESVGGGIVAADLDGDLDMDLVLIDGAGMSLDGEIEAIPGAGTRVYRNDGGFRFTDVTAASGFPAGEYLLGGAAADYDGDGDLDVFVGGYDAAHLLRNRGDGTFEDVTAAAGVRLARYDAATACAWADVDGDGRLDLFVCEYTDQRHIVDLIRAKSPGQPRACGQKGERVYCGPRNMPARPNRLFLQRQDHTFAEAPDHLDEPSRAAFQAVFSDLDGDGDLDAYVANDGIENDVLVNDGTGHLTDRGLETGASTGRDLDVQGSMGVAVVDFDRDGRLDVAVTNFVHEYNALYRNRTHPGGTVLFDDVSVALGFSRPPQSRVCWGVGLLDLDHDGVLDAFISSGHVYTEENVVAAIGSHVMQRNQVLRGLGPPRFEWEDVSERSGPHFRDERMWRAAVFPDLDGDGDPDVVLTAQHAGPAVLRNDGGERNAWVRFDLRPRKGLPSPAGARVTITLPDGSTRIEELHCGSSYASSDDPRLHFGLGTVEVLPRVDVRWPGGETTTVRDVAARRVVRVVQGE